MASCGVLPWAARRASHSGSRTIRARPLTRSVSSLPGTRKMSPMPRVLEQVPHPVEALVARAVRDQQGPVVHHQDEAGGVALGAHVAAARAVRGGHEHEGRPRDEGPAMLVEPADVLAQGDLGGLAHQRAQLVEGSHHVLELRRPIRSAHALPPGKISRAPEHTITGPLRSRSAPARSRSAPRSSRRTGRASRGPPRRARTPPARRGRRSRRWSPTRKVCSATGVSVRGREQRVGDVRRDRDQLASADDDLDVAPGVPVAAHVALPGGIGGARGRLRHRAAIALPTHSSALSA